MWRRGFWKVAEDGEPVLQKFCSVVREQNVQCLHVALLDEDPSHVQRRTKRHKMNMTVEVKRCYPGIVGGRHNDILAAELLEELRIVFLLCCMRTAENLLKERKTG